MALDRLPQRIDERLAASPGQMEPRHRVAVAEGAALGPVDDREETHAVVFEPTADVIAGAGDVLLGPPPRPHVVRLELRDPQPVRERELVGVLDPGEALLA